MAYESELVVNWIDRNVRVTRLILISAHPVIGMAYSTRLILGTVEPRKLYNVTSTSKLYGCSIILVNSSQRVEW